MGARLQSDVSAGTAGKKGAALNSADDDRLAPIKAQGMLNAHLQVNAAAVGANPKGVVKRSQRDPGASPEIPGGQLSGHMFSDNPSRGNSPKRSAGSKTPPQNPAKPSVTA